MTTESTGESTGAAIQQRPPALAVGPVGWLRANLFNSWYNAVLTLLILWLVASIIPPLVRWAIINSTVEPADAQTCRAAGGACWAFIQEKARLILFGLSPADQQWRPAVSVVTMIALILVTTNRRFWRPGLLLAWAVGLALVALLMWGGVAGLPYVENARWGGLPLTMILSVIGLGLAFPLAILLALGRRSDLPVIKTLSVAYVELIRGVPLISILFMASVMFPLF